MRKHRTVKFVAALIFLAALFYCLVSLAAAVWMVRGGAGWGPGWRGWILIPILVSALFGGTGLLVFGAVLFFLSKIENNLARATRGHAVAAPKPVDVRETLLAPPLVEQPPTVAEPVAVAGIAATAATDLAVAVEQPVERAEPPIEIEAAAPVVEASPLEAEIEPLAEIRAALPELVAEVGPAADVVALVIPAPAPEGHFPSVEIFEPELEVAAPKLEAVLPDVELPKIEVAAPRLAAADDVTALRAQLAALQARLTELETPPAAVVNVPVAPDRPAR